MSNISDFVMSAAVYAGLVVLAAFLRYRMTVKDGVPLRETTTFAKYLPEYPKQNFISLGICTLLFFYGSFFAAIPLLIWTVYSLRPNSKAAESQWDGQVQQINAAWLAHLGATHAQRLVAIDKLFTERRESVTAAFKVRWHVVLNRYNYVYFEVTRNLATMDNREREYLRAIELLNSAADGKNESYAAWRAALIWGDGKGVLGRVSWHFAEENQNASEPVSAKVAKAMQIASLSVDQVTTMMLQNVAELRSQANLPAELSALATETSDRFTGGGNVWLKPADLAKTVFAPASDYALRIGSFADGTPLTYSGEGSMVTIAPPGSGKTQCNVFPNLLTWKGPAVVLDISGDIYEKTSKWRAENVGPVFKFSPLEPETSHCYNPLTFVRNHPDFIWEDSRLLAELMIVPAGTSDPFWENEARTVLTAAIAHVCYSNAPEKRPMNEVLDIMFGGGPWDKMILGLRTAVDVRVMMQHANSLSSMNEKTLSSVLQTARSSLSAWTGERIGRVTMRSDWSPLDLRGGTNPTIYIYMRPNEVDSYLSLLRVFIGQHIRILTGGAVPPRGTPPILFMLDELPRLRYMPPVDEALNIGRKYGLRLWMFAQSLGQLQNAYENADGMMGSCVVRIFMNPSGADGLAEKLSEELGYIDSVNDSSRKRMVEATELSGPAYKDQQIVLGTGAAPAKVKKDFAWQDATLKPRMGSDEPAVAAQ
jgi:type IV secretion system protein VirD4